LLPKVLTKKNLRRCLKEAERLQNRRCSYEHLKVDYQGNAWSLVLKAAAKNRIMIMAASVDGGIQRRPDCNGVEATHMTEQHHEQKHHFWAGHAGPPQAGPAHP
jgi:hypothetical protein